MVSGWEAGIGEPGFAGWVFCFWAFGFGLSVRLGTFLVVHGPRIADLDFWVKVTCHKLKIKFSVENFWR